MVLHRLRDERAMDYPHMLQNNVYCHCWIRPALARKLVLIAIFLQAQRLFETGSLL